MSGQSQDSSEGGHAMDVKMQLVPVVTVEPNMRSALNPVLLSLEVFKYSSGVHFNTTVEILSLSSLTLLKSTRCV